MNGSEWGTERKMLAKTLALTALAGALWMGMMFLSEIKHYSLIGSDISPQTTISVSGEGEVYQAPDIAELSFAIVQESPTVSEANQKIADAMGKILAFLKDSGIVEKDIKNESYTFNPKYEWHQDKTTVVCPGGYCPPTGKQVLVGYEATQWVSVKIRKIDDAGKILSGLGDRGATNLSNIAFSVDQDDAVKAKARELAIADAKKKAEVLADQLGVTLVRIVSFNEGGAYPTPYAFGVGGAMAADTAATKSAVIPTGENKFTSNVTIVYEIK